MSVIAEQVETLNPATHGIPSSSVLIDPETGELKSYLKPREVMTDMRLGEGTVYAMLAAGEMPRVRARGTWRIPTDLYLEWRKDPEQWAADHAQKAQVIPLRRRTAKLRG